MNKKIKIQTQFNINDCAPCCLSMVFSFHGYEIEPMELKQGIQETSGWSMKDIKNIAEKKGLNGSAYYIDNPEGLGLISLPAIMYWDYNHFVVVEKIKKNRIYIIDPNIGKVEMDMSKCWEHFSGYVITFLKGENFRTHKESPIHRIRKITNSGLWDFRPSKVYLLVLLSYNILMFVIPVMISQFVGMVKSGSILGKDIALLFMACFSLASITYILEYLKNKMSMMMEKKSTLKIIKAILSKRPTDIENYTHGDLMSRIYMNLDIASVFAADLPTIISSILLIISFFTYLIFLDVKIADIFIGIIIFLMCINFILLKPILQWKTKEVFFLSKFRSVLAEGIEGFSFLKNSGITGNYYEKIKENLESYINCKSEINKFQSRTMAFQQISSLLYSMLASVTGIILLVNSPEKTDRIALIAFIVAMVFSPSMQVVTGIIKLINVYPNINLVLDITRESNGINDLKDDLAIQDGSIEVEGLYFKYPEMERLLMDNFSVNIRDGEHFVIYGESGTGKTTLINLLIGMEKRYSGNIRIGGIDIRSRSLDLRNSICYISQSDRLFNGTLEENIKLFCDSYTYAEIKNIVEKLKLKDIFSQRREDLKVRIVDNGSNFSSGQKQRLYLLRMFLKKYKIIIVDEPTSNLDENTSMSIFQEIKKIESTVLIITHNEKMIKEAENKIELKGCAIQDECRI